MRSFNSLFLVISVMMGIVSCHAVGKPGISCRLKVVLTADTLLVRTHLNEGEDLIEEYVRTGNDNFTPNATFICKRDDDEKVILNNKIHITRDSTSPISNSHTVPWHLFMQHGYCIPKLTAKEHQLTKADVGSLWEDEKGREFQLGKITGNHLSMLPKIRETNVEGIYSRDWEHLYSGYPSVLHHLSGGAHTDDIVITKGEPFQIRPIQKAIERSFYTDGQQITKYGVYECDEFKIVEILSCLNPFTVETWFPKPVMKDELMRITQSFTFCGLSTSYNTILDVKSPILFESYGCNQAKHLMKYKDYNAYVMLPRVKKLQDGHRVDMPFIQNTKRGNGVRVFRNSEDLYDVDKLPDREISYLYSPLRGYKLGFASGLSLTEGISEDKTRLKFIPMGTLTLNMSPSNRNKMYIKAINSEAFENRVLPKGFRGEFHSYFAYFDPSQNEGQVYWYKDGDDFYIYAHYQSKKNTMKISLPAMMNDCQLAIIDKTDGVELKSKIIEDGSLWLNYATDGANYIVIRAYK